MASRTKALALLLATAATSFPVMSSSAVPRISITSRFDGASEAYSAEGKAPMELREIHVQASGTGGPQRLSIFVLFDPASGAFSWRAQATEDTPKIPPEGTANFNNDHAAFLKDGEIVDFWALMFRMYIRDCRGIASSMDDAEAKALKAVAQSIDSQEDILGNGQDLFAVSLAAISNDFLYRPMTANPSISVPKITDVKWDVDNRHWIVTLQSRWTAVVILDGSYNVLSIKKVG